MSDIKNIARLIDHTLLRADAVDKDIERLCAEAVNYGFHAVCVNPSFVRKASGLLSGSQVRVVTVVGFPLGASTSGTKAREAMAASLDGADELDIVINIGQLKSGRADMVKRELGEVIMATRGLFHKAIIETCYLDEKEKKAAVGAALAAGAGFIKTSTGFGPSGARVEDVRLIREIVGTEAGVKAAGGIKTIEDLLRMVDAGATRIGTSSGVDIVTRVSS